MALPEHLDFGALLRRYRIGAGLTQEELAERAHLSARGISDLERGARSTPRKATVQLLADALSLTPRARARFEAAAQAGQAEDAEQLPVGGFLGARPAGPIVAREEQLERIRFAADVVEAGTGQLVLLVGEQGVGKTRLAQEAFLQLRDLGFLVATGRCYERTNQIAYYPLLEALTAASAVAPSAVRAGVGKDWPHLGGLLAQSGDGVPAPDDEVKRHQLFRDVTGFLAALGQEQPVALLFDDLHLADDASLDLLEYVTRHARSQRVLLLGTYRDLEADREHPLGQTVRRLAREGLVERVAVRRLVAEGTASLVVATVGQMEAAEEFVDFVHRRTKGNPFFVEKMLQAVGGRYRLVRQVGVGGMGRVFEAIDTATGRPVAVKIMFARTEADIRALLRFQQEGALLTTIKHPNIVEVHGTFTDEYASVIAMELLDGRSLGRILQTERLELSRVKRMAQQVMAALACAHDRGIVHRDIKPDNIMVLDDDRVKVTDFGIARMLRPPGVVTTMTSTGMTMGTPLYMAPEQIEGKTVDGLADLYSLGAVMYQMATGRPPFSGEDPMVIAFQHVSEPPQPPRTLNPALPEDWEALILKALSKDPAGRFPSAQCMGEAIAALGVSAASPLPMEKEAAPPAMPVPGAPGAVPSGHASDISEPAATPLATESEIEQTIPAPRSIARRKRANGLAVWAHGPNRIHLAAGGAVLGLAVILATVLHSAIWPGTSGPAPAASAPAGFVPWGLAASARPTGRSLASSVPFIDPAYVTVDDRGNVYVAEGNTENGQSYAPRSDIVKLSPGGQILARWGRQGAGRGELNQPAGMAVDASGNIYVADYGNNRIDKLSPAGRLLATFGSYGTLPGQFNLPLGTALDRQGNIYVADYLNHRIQKLSPDGKPLAVWGTAGARPGQFDQPAGLAVDASGNVYVADYGNRRIQKLSPEGKPLVQWAIRAQADNVFSGPFNVAVDRHGDVYVSDHSDNMIHKFSSTGAPLATWEGCPRISCLYPGVAVDGSGNVYVADPTGNRLHKLDPSGQPVPDWPAGEPAAPARFDSPSGVATDQQGNVYVLTGSANNQIETLSRGGTVKARWGPAALGNGQLYVLAGMAADGRGNLYALDVLNTQVLKLSPAGRILARWGREGTDPGQLSSPYGMAVDRKGNIYVADTGNNRVQKFSSTGRLLSNWTDQLDSPRAVAVDARGDVYIVDTGNNVIRKLSPTGQPLSQWGAKGSGPGQFNDPTGAALDSQGNVYVADSGNNRVEKFTSSGAFLAQWGRKGSRPGQFRGPVAVAVDRFGAVYVADRDNNRVQRLSARG